ncbi:hypothetical protein P7C71_g2247, partial [Lecanoromycetidae sp. Uapishka_2]
MLQRLSKRKWVSMHLERLLEIPSESPMRFLQSDAAVSSDFSKELNFGSDEFKYFLEYINGPDEGGTAERSATAFEAGMPGVMTRKEVKNEIDLGRWRLKIQGRIVRLEDLVSWDDGEIESGTLKGIVAELAACIGPNLVKETILNFN